jgi:hypothetical protein
VLTAIVIAFGMTALILVMSVRATLRAAVTMSICSGQRNGGEESRMNHWMILPILLPAIVAPLLALAVRNDIVLSRVFVGNG